MQTPNSRIISICQLEHRKVSEFQCLHTMALRKNNCSFHYRRLKWGQIVHPFFNSSQCYYTSDLIRFILQSRTTTYPIRSSLSGLPSCVRVHRNKPCRDAVNGASSNSGTRAARNAAGHAARHKKRGNLSENQCICQCHLAGK